MRPTVPSRFVQRLAAIAGARWESVIERGNTYLAWARDIDRPERVAAAPRPAPKPPRAARPTGLSVTEIEHWLRDPYTIYAKHVLRLKPLDEVDAAPGAAERGTIIHAAIRDFTQRFAASLPADPARELHRAWARALRGDSRTFPRRRPSGGRASCASLAGSPPGRPTGGPAIAAIAAEIRGEIEIPLAAGAFRLRGVADRIERLRTAATSSSTTRPARCGPRSRCAPGSHRSSRSKPRCCTKAGSKPSRPARRSPQLVYVMLKGGVPPGKLEPIVFKEGTPASHAERALAKLTTLVRRFDDDNEPYRSLVHPMWKARYGDYDHLARVKEWSATGGLEDEDFGSGAP